MASALKAMHNRGPDDRGEIRHSLSGGEVFLGHARLSVIDVSTGGHQPMESPDGRYVLCFNGEIYNYRELRTELSGLGIPFETQSDTEVLLAAWKHWGEETPQRLTGMFSFAVCDRQEGIITCVRDPFGIKPLFYALREDRFVFASEIAALACFLPGSLKVNPQRAYDYLVFGVYDNTEDSMIADIKHLRPAHLMTFDTNSGKPVSCRRWWNPGIEERPGITFDKAAEGLREIFLRNIRLHMRSDVPLGVALSGGLDSSGVTCAVRHVAPDMPLHTFSFVARGSEQNEEAWADRVIAATSSQATKVIIKPEELAADMDELVLAQGEPFASTSIYAQYRVFKAAKEHGITVMLEGQGADELLAGYGGYSGARLHSLLDRGRFVGAMRFLKQWSRWPGRKVRRALLELGDECVPSRLRGLALRATGYNPEPDWMKGRVLRELGARFVFEATTSAEDKHGRRLVSALRRALTGQGLPHLLRQGDRNAMRWSIENRVPFLTPEMAEFVLGLPEHYLVSPEGETKHVFRAAMRGIVPDDVLDRRDKLGFTTPERDWLDALGPRLDGWLEGIETTPFLDSGRARSLVREIAGGYRPFSPEAWRLINFCHWMRLTGVCVR